jgi:hypothetical protein
MEENARLVKQAYRGCWKRMLMERPHVRFDGEQGSRGRAGERQSLCSRVRILPSSRASL